MQAAQAQASVVLGPRPSPREVRLRIARLRAFLCDELRETMGDIRIASTVTRQDDHDTHSVLIVIVVANAAPRSKFQASVN